MGKLITALSLIPCMDVVCEKMFAPPAQINLLFFAFNDPLGNQWRARSTQLFQSPVQFVVGKAVMFMYTSRLVRTEEFNRKKSHCQTRVFSTTLNQESGHFILFLVFTSHIDISSDFQCFISWSLSSTHLFTYLQGLQPKPPIMPYSLQI